MVFENSPAFQGWARARENEKSRLGRKHASTVPDGTQVVGGQKPTAKAVGYFQRTNRAERLGVRQPAGALGRAWFVRAGRNYF